MSHIIYTAYRVQGLTAPQKAVFNTLAIHANTLKGEAWPSNQTLADETGLSIRSVQNAIKYLIEINYINVEYEGIRGSGNKFYETKRTITFNDANWRLPDDKKGRKKLNAKDPDLLNGVIRLISKK